MSYDYKQFYRRKLPHRHSPGATLFITFRLADSIPTTLLRQWLAENEFRRRAAARGEPEIEFRRRWFARFEDVLDKAANGPRWLADPRIAQIVADSLTYRDGRVYDLSAYCIMSNHVHTVFTPLLSTNSIKEVKGSSPLRFESTEATVPVIMKSLKGYTAREANKVLNRTGAFWEEESYDHEIKDGEEFGRVVRYVLNNPVKAGLVNHWSEWPWNYWKGLNEGTD
jgi:REP element-mobilizing transposase RayT